MTTRCALVCELKAKQPGCLLLFRVHDAYRAFMEDAEVISRLLGLTRHQFDGEVCAAFPYHNLEGYLAKLVKCGQRVAVIEPASL